MKYTGTSDEAFSYRVVEYINIVLVENPALVKFMKEKYKFGKKQIFFLML